VTGEPDKGEVKASDVSTEASAKAKHTIADWNFILFCYFDRCDKVMIPSVPDPEQKLHTKDRIRIVSIDYYLPRQRGRRKKKISCCSKRWDDEGASRKESLQHGSGVGTGSATRETNNRCLYIIAFNSYSSLPTSSYRLRLIRIGSCSRVRSAHGPGSTFFS
jgi:hypothetical protein